MQIPFRSAQPFCALADVKQGAIQLSNDTKFAECKSTRRPLRGDSGCAPCVADRLLRGVCRHSQEPKVRITFAKHAPPGQ
jgi:hypothetical protein